MRIFAPCISTLVLIEFIHPAMPATKAVMKANGWRFRRSINAWTKPSGEGVQKEAGDIALFEQNEQNRAKMTTFHEQPQIEFPAELIALGFEDQSYSNDLAAFTVLTLADGRCIGMWITEEKREDREWEDSPRFEAWETTTADDAHRQYEPETFLYQGEDLAECIVRIQEVRGNG